MILLCGDCARAVGVKKAQPKEGRYINGILVCEDGCDACGEQQVKSRAFSTETVLAALVLRVRMGSQ